MQTILQSKTKKTKIDTEGPMIVIGEKINPTGRKKLAAALQEGNFEYVKELAQKQIDAGADILDINVGVPELDQKLLMKKSILTLTTISDLPLCIDSDDPEVIEIALKTYPGIALINSVNGKRKSLEKEDRLRSLGKGSSNPIKTSSNCKKQRSKKIINRSF